VRLNPLPDNRAPFAETVDRIKRNDPHPLKPRRARTPEGQAWKQLEDGDFKGVLALAAHAPNWKVRRASVSASEFRFESENAPEVTSRALENARLFLGATNGVQDTDALICRMEALRIRETAMYPVEPPCPLGTRMANGDLKRVLATAGVNPATNPAGAMQAAQLAQQAVASGAGGDPDPVVFPGQKIARLSDYVRVMKAMQSGNPMGALAQMGLDMGTYSQAAMAWGQKMAQDPTLTAKFTKMMQAR
jgi:hypothetical protein